MRQLAALLLLITAALPIGAKWKVKEKRFDPVTVTNVQQIAGRYVGIDPDYVLDLKISSEGVISGTIRNFGQTSNLRSIRVDGSEFTAMIDSRPLHATFVNPIRNGEPAFGLLVHDAEPRRRRRISIGELEILPPLRGVRMTCYCVASTLLSCSRACRSVILV